MKKVLQISVHLFPNVGGVETHLKDLIGLLISKNWKVFVLAYQPLSTQISWKIFEKAENLTILRIPWIRGFFEKLVRYPILEFCYLIPFLFFATPFIILLFKPDILHAHGISAAVAAVFWGRLFRIRTVVSLHSFYAFPEKGLYRGFVRLILRNTDFVLSLSKKSNQEIKSLGIKDDKSGIFTYWIDLNRFKKIPDAKKQLRWEKIFTVLFVGRLIEEKGISILIDSVKLWNKNIKLIIIGVGPMSAEIAFKTNQNKQISFLGKINQEDLPLYYSGAELLIVPSIAEEGFGRVVIESLACGTPVIASNRGAIPEAMDESVGKLIDINADNIKDAVLYYFNNPLKLKLLSTNSRKFVERRYSEKNGESIICSYSD